MAVLIAPSRVRSTGLASFGMDGGGYAAQDGRIGVHYLDMTGQVTVPDAAAQLTTWLKNDPRKEEAQKAALDYYGRLFRPDNLPNVTQDEFKDFLLLKNNKHWASIHRQPNIYADMD